MKELTDVALSVATAAGAKFSDIRIIEEHQNRIFVRQRSLKWIDETESLGYGIRVLLNGAWGFASSTKLVRDEVAKTAKLAVEIAKASALAPKATPAEMLPESTSIQKLAGTCKEDPFKISNSEKADYLLKACDSILNVDNVAIAMGALFFIRRRRIIANSDGSFLDLTNTFSNPMLEATAVIGTESQSRRYQGGAKQAGYEFIRKIDMPGNARKWAEEAVMICKADDSPEGIMDLVLDPNHLALTMHESVGHPTELDRILGWEANMAGRSFVTPADVGSLKYGSDLINFTADNLMPDGVGSWFYDDDGVKLDKFPVISNGVLVNLSTTRETAPMIGWKKSNGCCRSDSYNHFPINRIPNLYLEPGKDNLSPEDLIAGVKKGVYIEGMGSFSIDQMRNNFQFGGDLFWLIENGKLVKPLKKVTYQAQTRQFWNSCDALAGPKHWSSHGVMNCGKGEPAQIMCMTHGASHARFRNIKVGGAKI